MDQTSSAGTSALRSVFHYAAEGIQSFTKKILSPDVAFARNAVVFSTVAGSFGVGGLSGLFGTAIALGTYGFLNEGAKEILASRQGAALVAQIDERKQKTYRNRAVVGSVLLSIALGGASALEFNGTIGAGYEGKQGVDVVPVAFAAPEGHDCMPVLKEGLGGGATYYEVDAACVLLDNADPSAEVSELSGEGITTQFVALLDETGGDSRACMLDRASGDGHSYLYTVSQGCAFQPL